MTTLSIQTWDDNNEKWTLSVGDEILDDLTGKNHKVIRLEKDEKGRVGVFIDSNYLDGGRHVWEITRKKI